MARRKVSRNPEWAVILRAVGTTIPATDLLYQAADMLVPILGQRGDTREDYVHNVAVCEMVCRLLDLPVTDIETVDRVLRNLPDREG